MIPGPAARRGAGVVHQHGDVAERRVDLVLQGLHALELADIGRHGDNSRASGRRGGRHVAGGPVERLGRQISQADLQAHRGEVARRRQADPARCPRHDSNATGGKSGMGAHGSSFRSDRA
jgi:hypothetical protein